MIPPIFPLVATVPAITALVGTDPVRVYRAGRAPQGSVAPYVTWSIVSDSPAPDLDGGGMVHFRVQVNSFSADEDECDELDAAVQAAIENDGENVSLGLSVDEVDQATGLYRMSRDFSLWVPRS